MAKTAPVIHVHDKMQQGYSYQLTAPTGKNFAPGFTPHFTPQQMLKLGVFEGKYCNDCQNEFPKSWFTHAKTSAVASVSCNFFKVKSRQPLSTWQNNGWIIEPDPRGWFQWYCRYYLGRRLPGVDDKQIARWKSFARHAGQIRANCAAGDLTCRPRQRQALLQWSYDCFI
ncbi:MAG: hypothetical protein GC129_05300 [Proteobacteria bacterium]|nr:hypothetical protein [Pseudomonadota bacterium]